MEIGLQFLMQKTKNKIRKTFVYQFEYFFHIESSTNSIKIDFSDDKHIGKSLDFILNSTEGLIEIIYFNSHPSIVPSLHFDDNIKDKYLTTNTLISKTILTDTSNDKKIKVVYSISDKLTKELSKSKIEYSNNNYFTYLYNFINDKVSKSEGLSFFVNLNHKSFDIVIFNNYEFIFFNSFIINNENEFLYYLFFVLKNYEGSNKTHKITFLGKFEEFKDYYDITSKYSLIEFIEDNNNSYAINYSPFFSIINEDYIRN